MLVDPGVYMVDFDGFYVGKYTIVPPDRDYMFRKGSQTYTPKKKNERMTFGEVLTVWRCISY